MRALRFNDFCQRERASDHHHGDARKNEWDFVTDHLRHGAHGAEESILVPTRPAGHEHRQFRRRTDSEKEQQAGVKIHDDHVTTKRDHGIDSQRDDDEDHRREEVDEFVRRARDEVFLDKRLDAIGGELQETERPDAIRAVTILDSAKSFAFEHGGDGEEGRKHHEHRREREDCRDDRQHGRRQNIL